MAEQNALNRRLVRKQQNGTLGQTTEEPEDTMGPVTVGDTYNIQPTGPVKSGPSALGTIGTALLGAAIPTAALAAYWYGSLPKEKPPVTAPSTTDTDTDTRYSIRFGEE